MRSMLGGGSRGVNRGSAVIGSPSRSDEKKVSLWLKRGKAMQSAVRHTCNGY